MASEINVSHTNYHVTTELERQYEKYCDKIDINIFCGTWNVNGKEPKDDLKSWLLPSEITSQLFVLSFQEIVDLNATNVIFDSDAPEKWHKKISDLLGETYKLLKTHRLVGILLLVYAKNEVCEFITDCVTTHVAVGLFGHVGNKGGVGFRCKIYDSTVCFVSSHLAAHKNNVHGRNQDFTKIMQNLRFCIEDDEKELSPTNHDFIFWLGDLNYRLTADDLEEVYNKIDECDMEWLLDHDQLSKERSAKRAFQEFQEGNITFWPTYKFVPGGDGYDRRKDKKIRFPAWCDRILWKKGSTTTCKIEDISLNAYDCSIEQNMSDHKPVYAHFNLSANRIDQGRYEELGKNILRKLDKKTNDKKEKVRLPQEFVFRDVKFGEPMTLSFDIENRGQVQAGFEFQVPEMDQHHINSWLHIDPLQGVIPKSESLTVNITIHISRESVSHLAESNNQISQIVIFKLSQGTLQFITISGNYITSCYGQSIETLTKLLQPIAFVDMQHLIDPEKVGRKSLTLPRELWRMVDHLYKFGMDEKGLFASMGVALEVSQIRECLDTGREFIRIISMHSMTEALVRFLESLAEPVFDISYLDGFQEAAELPTFWHEKLRLLPICNYNIFLYIISFLQDLLAHSGKNLTSAQKLAYIFGSCLFQQDLWTLNEHTIHEYASFRIVYYFLEEETMQGGIN